MAKTKPKRNTRKHRSAEDLQRAGFVMSSQASSAGGGEAKVCQKLIETGDVDVMVAIREDIQATPAEPYTVVPGNAITVAASSHSKRAGGPNV